jgi:hypothetical protein
MGGFSTRFGSPSLPVVSLDPNSNAYPAGHHFGDVLGLTDIEPNLIPDNILYGIKVFGVTGNATHWLYTILPSALQIPPPVLSVVNTNVIAGVPVNIAKTLAIVTPSLSLNSDVTVPLPVDGFVSHVQVPLADTDETAAANSGTPDDMDLLPASLSGDGDGCYFGLATEYDWVVVKVSTAGTGTYHITWKYWNGSSFVTLTTFNDITNSFKTIGGVQVMFNRPVDWAATAIAGITAYWIKAEVDSGAMTIQPKGQQAYIGQY